MPSSIIDDTPPFSTVGTGDYWVDRETGRRIGEALPLHENTLEERVEERIQNLENATNSFEKEQTKSKEYWLKRYGWMKGIGVFNIMGEDLLILNSWDVEETECKHEECGWYCKEKRI